jgi:hypothetical protein
MATSSHLHPTNMSSMARGNVSLTPGSHIWFGSLEFIITKEGDDLDLVPPINKPADFPKPVDDLRHRSDELRNTWSVASPSSPFWCLASVSGARRRRQSPLARQALRACGQTQQARCGQADTGRETGGQRRGRPDRENKQTKKETHGSRKRGHG